ncbi:MAG: AAA family ATPase [Armatimonadia bacterium]
MASPEIVIYGDTYMVRWPDYLVGMTVDSLKDSAWGVEGLVMVHLLQEEQRVIWGPVKVNLTKTADIVGLVKTLRDICDLGGGDWNGLIAQGFASIVTRWRDGAETVSMADVPEPDAPRYQISDFLLDQQTTLLAADGNTGKSYFALAVALSCVTGNPLLGGRLTPIRTCPVLYVDWETDQHIQSERTHRICRGMGLMAVPQDLHYMRAFRSIADMIRPIKRKAAEIEAGLVIIDSIGPACGAELEKSDVALRAMNAVNELYPATRLVIAHVSKASRDVKASDRTAFGSIFFQNVPRSVWAMQRTQMDDADEVDCALMHTKCNIGKRFSPIAYRMCFHDAEPSTVEFQAARIEDNAELVDHARLEIRIRVLLRDEAHPLSAPEIAKQLETSGSSIRGTLKRMLSAGQVVKFAAGREVSWALASHRDEDEHSWE